MIQSFTGMLSHRQTPREGNSSFRYKKQQMDVQPFDKEDQQFAIDAVLIDFNMPRMNGPDTIVEMRKMWFRGPIIGVSGGEEETSKQFLEAGADDVLQKPAKTDQLLSILMRGFQVVVREETTGHSTDASEGGSDDGINIKTPACGSENSRQEHITHLRQFVEEMLTSTAKK